MELGTVHYTGFRHITYITPENVSAALKLAIPIWALQEWALALVKISVALMLLRIKQVSRWRLGLICLIVIIVLASIAGTIMELFQCRPLKAYWDTNLAAHAVCWSPEAVQVVSDTYCCEPFPARP
jgi:hypothetical protein